MYLFKVYVKAKKQWMESYIELAFVTIADTADNAVKKVMDEYDLEGVIIQGTSTKKVEKGIISIGIKEKF
jgi:hypothetical protein